MAVSTEENCSGFDIDHPLANHFDVLRFVDGSISFFPKKMRVIWTGETFTQGRIAIGRCTGIGHGATVRYNDTEQVFALGRFTSIGARLRIILGGFHELRTMSTSKVQGYNPRLTFGVEPSGVPTRVTIGSDVWIGDDVTIMAGAHVADGCVIGAGSLLPPGATTEPYGIYAGRPARLTRFRFDARVVEALMELRWWEWGIDTLEAVQSVFTTDLTADADSSLRLLKRLADVTRGTHRESWPT